MGTKKVPIFLIILTMERENLKMTELIAPSQFWLFGFFPTFILSVLIPVTGAAAFAYIIAKRLAPLVLAAPDKRFDNLPLRIYNLFKIWLAQYRQPRYMLRFFDFVYSVNVAGCYWNLY